VDRKFHAFINSALGRGERSASHSFRLCPEDLCLADHRMEGEEDICRQNEVVLEKVRC
jgi:hypothetical protein